jgi:hypothetical protein
VLSPNRRTPLLADRRLAAVARWLSSGVTARRRRAATVPSSTTRTFHLTNYIQQGIDVRDVPADHGHARRPLDAVRHPAAAAVVVRQLRTFAPTYYLQSDAPLYYYSFTDAYIATVYRRCAEQARASIR